MTTRELKRTALRDGKHKGQKKISVRTLKCRMGILKKIEGCHGRGSARKWGGLISKDERNQHVAGDHAGGEETKSGGLRVRGSKLREKKTAVKIISRIMSKQLGKKRG